MKRAHILSLLAIAFAALSALPAGADWNLGDNNPNPFCNIPGEPDYSPTTIDYELDSDGLVQLFVLSEDGENLMRTLVSGFESAGSHFVVWDGTDSGGTPMTAGDYPYVLEVYAEGGGDLLYLSDSIASIYCAVATAQESWTMVKSLYRD
ncbi:hypothetical protein H8E52_01475 [bacterium]|nr:hypothetical protein [bacterium]